MNGKPAHETPGNRTADKKIRGVELLEDERVVGLLDGASGLAEAPTRRGSLLALTDRRVIAFLDAEDRRETHAASIDRVQGVTVRAHRRPLKPLLQGVVLILAGILVYLVVGTFSTGIPVNAGITIGALLGGAVALLGLLYVVKFLFWDQGGELVFQTGGMELAFLYNSDKASVAVQQVLSRFFQMQTGLEAEPLYPHADAPPWPHLLRMPPPPAPKKAPAVPPEPETPRKRDRKTWSRRVRPWTPVVRSLRREPERTRGGRVRTLRLRRRPLGAPAPKPRSARVQIREKHQLIRLRRHPLPMPGRNGIRRKRRRRASYPT